MSILNRAYLSNSILALDNWENSLLLNWRRFNKTMTVDSSEYTFFKSHVVEAFDDFFPIGSELFFIYEISQTYYFYGIKSLTCGGDF
jgi:hypothetical protein